VTGPAYKIELEPRARKNLALLDVPVRRRVSAVIEKLANQPRPSGAVARRVKDPRWRLPDLV